MSVYQRQTCGAAGRGKNKRKWTTDEHEWILDLVLELKGDPRWRCGGGFKNGFYKYLEGKYEIRYPGSALTASQIESKLKWMKEKYIVIHEMTKLSGFTWNDTSCMISGEKQAFDEFCKMHPRAKGLWKTPFVYYNKLELIFGSHRATENHTEDVEDMIHNIDIENGDREIPIEVDDYSSSDASSRPPLAKKQMLGKSSFRAAKKSDSLTIALAEIQGSLDKIANAMVKSEKREELLSTQKSKLLSEIYMLPGVSDEDAIDVLDVILTSTNRIQAFYNCPNDHWKKLYVQKIIDRLRGSSCARQG